MRILFLGDIVGKNGREAIKKYLKKIVNEYSIDFVIANGENASHGKGLSFLNYKELINYGIDAITLGNHWLNKTEIMEYIDDADKLIKPLNSKANVGGLGSRVFVKNNVKIRVTNLLGEAFLEEKVEEPYVSLTKFLVENDEKTIHIVDFHAESTSEKQIIGYCFDGRVTAVLGTHTHVQTNDDRILPKGTAFMCDVGMCGQYNGVIGFDKKTVINKIIFGSKEKFDIDINDVSQISGVILNCDEKTCLCNKIEKLHIIESVK